MRYENLICFCFTSKFFQLFSLNSTSGILSTNKPLDRETKSLYIVPIKVMVNKKVTNTSVTVFVDDEADNGMSVEILEIAVTTTQPLFTGVIPLIYPANADEVYTGQCEKKQLPNLKIEV